MLLLCCSPLSASCVRLVGLLVVGLVKAKVQVVGYPGFLLAIEFDSNSMATTEFLAEHATLLVTD